MFDKGITVPCQVLLVQRADAAFLYLSCWASADRVYNRAEAVLGICAVDISKQMAGQAVPFTAR